MTRRYVLDRDRRPPHESQPLKACSRCGTLKGNTFAHFAKLPWGPRKYGRYTTGNVCRTCLSDIASATWDAKREADRRATDAMVADAIAGTYLTPKVPAPSDDAHRDHCPAADEPTDTGGVCDRPEGASSSGGE